MRLLPTAVPVIFPRGQTGTKSETPRVIIDECMAISQEEPEQIPTDNDADVRDDVGGAQVAGMAGILVKTGKYWSELVGTGQNW
ncbi:Hypp9034 [Branchiostoma lanceolatum]|uniref:Hypp9034 protein n=1 Tax=Branchiostoma lanceolatum TaxID=7740 RepID=A0A8J9ZCR5_BRALA|nr:Hypp9034 [Branchiostoma lanceolatum]